MNHVVSETCPHCNNEISIAWDVQTQGFETICPICGNRLMLCDECLNRLSHGEVFGCDFNSLTGTCHLMKCAGGSIKNSAKRSRKQGEVNEL